MTKQDKTTTTPTTLGAAIKQARERMGLSLRALEAITDISRPSLNRLELDQVDTPNPTQLHTLADALELNSDDLFAYVGYRPSKNLPSLAPYLRAKYQLPPDAVAEANEALQQIMERYEQTPADDDQDDQGNTVSSGTRGSKRHEEA